MVDRIRWDGEDGPFFEEFAADSGAACWDEAGEAEGRRRSVAHGFGDDGVEIGKVFNFVEFGDFFRFFVDREFSI
jgi:hypothetical protein